MLFGAACADPEGDDASDFSSRLEGDAGARREAGGDAKSDAMLEAGAAAPDDGAAETNVVQMQLDDDRDDADKGLLDPVTSVDAGHWVRATLPVTELCSTWGVQGGGDIAATVLLTDEKRDDGTSVRHFTWKPSKPALYTLRFVSGPRIIDHHLCSYSGILSVN